MSKLTQKPKEKLSIGTPTKFQRFHLSDNPFPAEPMINKDAEDPRINGSIYEAGIRSVEYEKVRDRFLVQPQANPNHLRLGYIIDTSYVGRGNGKSAFLVNLQQSINDNFCLDVSDGANKCFAVYVTPEPSGRTRTFSNLVDSTFSFVLKSRIIDTALASLRLEALTRLSPEKADLLGGDDDNTLLAKLGDEQWWTTNGIDLGSITAAIFENEYLVDLPPTFPLCRANNSFFQPFITQMDFEAYYKRILKRPKEKLDFFFSHLVLLFLASGFNGAYILVDNFEQIAIPQSAKQKLDFAFELRSCLYDGTYVGSRIGFYNFFLTFHVGVERLISEAWSASGMETRSPISSRTFGNHIVQFENLNADHVALLLRKYLSEYRINGGGVDELYPFKMEAVALIGQRSEFNASNILRMAFGLLEKLADSPNLEFIDAGFVNSAEDIPIGDFEKASPTIDTEQPLDLHDKTDR